MSTQWAKDADEAPPPPPQNLAGRYRQGLVAAIVEPMCTDCRKCRKRTFLEDQLSCSFNRLRLFRSGPPIAFWSLGTSTPERSRSGHGCRPGNFTKGEEKSSQGASQ